MDEASPSDSATPLMLAIQKDRPDVLREVQRMHLWDVSNLCCFAAVLLCCSVGQRAVGSAVHTCHSLWAACSPAAAAVPPCAPYQILKHSSRWSLTVEGKPWTPLCYALAQASMGEWAAVRGLELETLTQCLVAPGAVNILGSLPCLCCKCRSAQAWWACCWPTRSGRQSSGGRRSQTLQVREGAGLWLQLHACSWLSHDMRMCVRSVCMGG